MVKGGYFWKIINFNYLEPVPQVYVLPPELFAEEVNFGEVEFPMDVKFFITKAFMNPENKIIIVGEKTQLERIRITVR